MNKRFELFQKEFKKYQRLFSLTGYKVYFEHDPKLESFASITVDQLGRSAHVRFSGINFKGVKPQINIKGCAKHEAIHLLISRLENLAKSRYTTEDEIYEADEELACKLENLIP